MTTLNDRGAEQARAAGAHALTDVTGFGLLGHLHELAEASGLAAEIDAAAVPAIDGVLDLLAGEEALAGGSKRNRADAEGFTSWADGVPEPRRRLLCDAMTSGGLLAAIPAGAAMEGAAIGRLVAGEPGTIARGASAAGRRASKRPSRMPATPPPRPASECGLDRGERQQHEHDGDREHAEQVRVVLLAAAAREHVAHRPGGEQARAPTSWRPRERCRRRARATSAEPAAPPTKNTSSGAQAPWRRSSSQPKRKTAPSATIS